MFRWLRLRLCTPESIKADTQIKEGDRLLDEALRKTKYSTAKANNKNRQVQARLDTMNDEIQAVAVRIAKAAGHT